MSFSTNQVRVLRRNLNRRYIRQRENKGRTFSYVESWHAISEANRIFGFDGWDRETIEARNLVNRESKGIFLAVYMAKVRVTVRAGGVTVVREGHGSGEGRGASPGEAHDLAIKAAETDATKRALTTFGKPFGLSLYLIDKDTQRTNTTRSSSEAQILEDREAANADTLAKLSVERATPTGPAEAATAIPTEQPSRIDKTVLHIGAQKRTRDKHHLRYVASQPCLLCGRNPSDPHHLRFAQLSALGSKVSDEFTVPLCRMHHRQLHQSGNEAAWWNDLEMDPLAIARELWEHTRTS